MLRKGGIVEADRGGFHLRERKFLLFPTYEHEHTLLLKPQYTNLMRPGCAGEITISILCTVTDVMTSPGWEGLKRADDLFIWNDTFLRKRLEYKPNLLLYCILLRAHRLPAPVTIPDRPSYAGCKSWIHLTEDIDIDRAEPVLTDEQYASKRDALLTALG